MLRKSCLLAVPDQFSELQGPEKAHKLLNKVLTYFSLLYAMDFKRKLHCYNLFWQWSAERVVYESRPIMFPHTNKLYCPHIAVWCSGLMVSALNNRANTSGSRPSQGHHIVFLDRAQHFTDPRVASLHTGLANYQGQLSKYCGREKSNTPRHFTLQKREKFRKQGDAGLLKALPFFFPLRFSFNLDFLKVFHWMWFSSRADTNSIYTESNKPVTRLPLCNIFRLECCDNGVQQQCTEEKQTEISEL